MALPSRSTWNVIQVGIGFHLLFVAFNTQSFIEETVIESVARDSRSINKYSGYYSLSIIYFFFTFGNFFAVPFVELVGPRLSMCISSCAYTIFVMGFLFLNQYYLYLSSAFVGLGSAVLWTANGYYLTLNTTERTSHRNSAMMWALLQSCLITGGIFLFFVFHFVPNESDHIDRKTINILYGGFMLFAILGNITIALLRPPPISSASNGTREKLTFQVLMISTFKLMATREMLLLSIVFMFSGISLSFWSGVYSTCIAFTQALGHNTHELVAFNAIALGTGQLLGGSLFGVLGNKIRQYGRYLVIEFGCVINVITFTLIFINIPANATLKQTNDRAYIEPKQVLPVDCTPLAIVSGVLLGFGDSCWNTQIYSILVDFYPNQSPQAFAIMKFYQALLSCAAFFYGAYLQLHWHLLILLIASITGGLCFFIVERIFKKPIDLITNPISFLKIDTE